MHQSNRSFNIPRAFEFLENFCSNSPHPGPKSCSNAPTRTCLRGRSAGLFPEQRLVIEPKKLLFFCKDNFNIFTYLKINIMYFAWSHREIFDWLVITDAPSAACTKISLWDHGAKYMACFELCAPFPWSGSIR